MSEIKRYDPVAIGWSGAELPGQMQEFEAGDYVKYDDHVAELARLMERCMDGEMRSAVRKLIEVEDSCEDDDGRYTLDDLNSAWDNVKRILNSRS